MKRFGLVALGVVMVALGVICVLLGLAVREFNEPATLLYRLGFTAAAVLLFLGGCVALRRAREEQPRGERPRG